MLSRARTVTVALVLMSALVLGAAPASAATGAITGTAYQDLDRDAVRDPGETVLANQQLYLFTGDGATYLAQATTDTAGSYRFDGVADGDYVVRYASPSWSALRNDWVPTTTGSVLPVRAVHVAGGAVADFGWRPIVRSTDAAAPIASLTAPSGMVIATYDDAVTPAEIADRLAGGAPSGAEAPAVTVRFDLSSTSTTTISVGQDTTGWYTGYRAVVNIAWGSWLDHADQSLFHEYGHAWSLFHAYISRQDPSMGEYVSARGLSGNPNLNTTYVWDVRELIAEDYRQLFGSPAAAAAPQMNTAIPPAGQVAGLREFLATTFSTALSAPAPAPPPPPPALTVASPSVTPQPVVKSATISGSVSAPATVTLVVVNASGTVVRTLLNRSPLPAGAFSVRWDRKDASGRRVASGSYSTIVTATDGSTTATATTAFRVS